jgi:hypothetical protein|tara:strand:- start:832 stop:1230 length:399 start_codon:yes stop_codon:yes gene_type:complete
MSFISRLFGSGTKGIGELAKDLREAIKGKELDPNKQIETATKLAELQAKINEVEASHRSIFVAGWRPFTGWLAAVGLGYAVFLEPLLRFVAKLNGYEGEFPIINTTITMQVLLGMLGLGGLRSWEKSKGVAK